MKLPKHHFKESHDLFRLYHIIAWPQILRAWISARGFRWKGYSKLTGKQKALIFQAYYKPKETNWPKRNVHAYTSSEILLDALWPQASCTQADHRQIFLWRIWPLFYPKNSYFVEKRVLGCKRLSWPILRSKWPWKTCRNVHKEHFNISQSCRLFGLNQASFYE